jgi:hypothetical protein
MGQLGFPFQTLALLTLFGDGLQLLEGDIELLSLAHAFISLNNIE